MCEEPFPTASQIGWVWDSVPHIRFLQFGLLNFIMGKGQTPSFQSTYCLTCLLHFFHSLLSNAGTIHVLMLCFLSLLQPWFKANVCVNCFHPTKFKVCEHSRRERAIWNKDSATLKPEHLQHQQQGNPRIWAGSQAPEEAAELAA